MRTQGLGLHDILFTRIDLVVAPPGAFFVYLVESAKQRGEEILVLTYLVKGSRPPEVPL